MSWRSCGRAASVASAPEYSIGAERRGRSASTVVVVRYCGHAGISTTRASTGRDRAGADRDGRIGHHAHCRRELPVPGARASRLHAVVPSGRARCADADEARPAPELHAGSRIGRRQMRRTRLHLVGEYSRPRRPRAVRGMGDRLQYQQSRCSAAVVRSRLVRCRLRQSSGVLSISAGCSDLAQLLGRHGCARDRAARLRGPPASGASCIGYDRTLSRIASERVSVRLAPIAC